MTEIIDRLFKRASEVFIPLVTTIEITQNCNFKCNHCYNFDRNNEMPLDIKENLLKSEEILRIIDEVAISGALYLNFTGGEVLLHPHLDSFIKKARTHHLEVRLKTNGSLLTKKRCEKLNNIGLAGMDISLYGFSEVSYRKLTGKLGMFLKTIEGIKTAKSQGFDVSVSIILHRYNLDELSAMVNFCKENLIAFNFSSEITERYDNTAGARDYEITAEQFRAQLAGEFKEIFMYNNSEKSLQCSCAKMTCGISSTGEVYPCIGAPIASGNLRDKPFEEIWRNSKVLNNIRNLKSTDFKNCQTCKHIEHCNRSSGGIYVNTKEYTGCDPITYQQAKLRHEFHL